MSGFDVGARVNYRSSDDSAWSTVTIIRANDNGTFDVAPADEAGSVIEAVDASQLQPVDASRKDSNLSNDFDSDSEDGAESATEAEKEAAARRIQNVHRRRAQAAQEEAAAKRIQAAHRARSPRGPTGRRFSDEDAREEKSHLAVNGIIPSDGSDDSDGGSSSDNDEPSSRPARDTLQLRPLGPSSADFSSLQDTLDNLTNRVNDLTQLANAHAKQLQQKDHTIRVLTKKLKKVKNEGKKAMAKSYKHHAKTFAGAHREREAMKKQIAELLQEKEDNTAIRDDLLKRVADNARNIQENWQTIKHYRALLEEKADSVDVTSKVEKADVIRFIEERQSSWESIQNESIQVNVVQQFSEVQNNFKQIVSQQQAQLKVTVSETRQDLDAKIEDLQKKIGSTTEATEALARIGEDLQGGHLAQDRQLAELNTGIEGLKQRLLDANIAGIKDDVSDVKQDVTGIKQNVADHDSYAERISSVEDQLSQRIAEVEGLRSQLNTLVEQQQEQQQQHDTLMKHHREQLRRQEERRQEEEQKQKEALENSGRGRRPSDRLSRSGRKTGRSSRSRTTTSRGSAETKTNGRPHTSRGRMNGSVSQRHKARRNQAEPEQDAGLNVVVGTKVRNPKGPAAQSVNEDGSVNYGADAGSGPQVPEVQDQDPATGDWEGADGQSFDSAGYDDSYDNDSRVRTLEQRMAQTVEILAHSMSRMEKNILALADSDPLRRSGVNISTTHDARLNSVMNAYNTSSTRAAKKKTQHIVKIGDRGDSLHFEAAPPAGNVRASPKTSSLSPQWPQNNGTGYKSRGGDRLVDIHSGRKANGTWAFSPAQVTFRHKETRDLAQKGRSESPMRNQLGRDGHIMVLQEDAAS